MILRITADFDTDGTNAEYERLIDGLIQLGSIGIIDEQEVESTPDTIIRKPKRTS